MSSILYLTPTTDSALAHIAEHVRHVRQERPLAPLTFLLPSGDAIRQLRQVLGNVVAVRFLQFYNLGSAALSEAGSATHEISDLATRRVVRGILREVQERKQLTTFAQMLDRPGFIDVLIEWLREMKTQGITSDAVMEHASASGKPRDLQLALLYSRYEAALRRGDCADADGLLWLAAEALERDPSLLANMGELVLAGFDQFSPVQVRMVTALANRIPLTVYLLWDEARLVSSLALGRLAPTREALLRALAPAEIPLAPLEACGPALAHVRRSLFEAGIRPAPDEARCIQAVAAPSAEGEVRHALRRVKQLLLDGVREEQIALLAPHPQAYRLIVATVSREYGVPVECETTLGENPCVAALLNVLSLAPAFPWRATFDALRSPYIKQPWLDGEQIALLDALTRERPVVAGQEQWWYALGQHVPGHAARGQKERATGENEGGLPAEEMEDEDRRGSTLIERLPQQVLADLCAGLEAFFQHLTPPENATQARYVAWIQDAILGLGHEGEEEDKEPPGVSLHFAKAAAQGEWANRDLRALQTLLQALRMWLDAGVVAGELGLKPTAETTGGDQSWGDSELRELLEWLPSMPLPPDRRLAAVRFGPLEMNRAVTVDHLFVLGLGEGELPRQPTPDPFYTAAERASHPLSLVKVRSAEDASLWWQVLCNCQCSLTLFRSRFDANGAEWQPSPYWTAVVDLVEGLSGRVEKPSLSARPNLAEAACSGELLEALACCGAATAPALLAGQWNRVRAAHDVAAVRDGWTTPGRHEGVVRDNDLIAALQRRYGPGNSWSVSRLNRIGTCPYAFWAQQALQLEQLADPAEGLDALQRGSLVHKLLERLFARLAQEGMAPRPEAVGEVTALLDEVCDQILPRAAERYAFRPGPLWDHEQNELRKELRAYMAWECEPKQAGAFSPFAQELRFGMDARGQVTIPGFEGAEIALRGVIDRIDSDGAGHFRVIDYKTGSRKFTDNDIAAGRALQSALYAWAVEALMPEGVVVETCYRHTGSRSESGSIKGSPARENETVLRASAKAVQLATSAVEGWFPPAPSRGSAAKACDEKCDYLGLCRVTRHGVRKAQRAGLPLVGGELPSSAQDASGTEPVTPSAEPDGDTQ